MTLEATLNLNKIHRILNLSEEFDALPITEKIQRFLLDEHFINERTAENMNYNKTLDILCRVCAAYEAYHAKNSLCQHDTFKSLDKMIADACKNFWLAYDEEEFNRLKAVNAEVTAEND